MRYIMLIHQGTALDDWATMSEAERAAFADGYRALNETPGVTPGERMEDPGTATTVRVAEGRTLITDGPFAEIKEAVGGYFFLEADDLDAAIAVAASVPSAQRGGAVEIRPLAG